MRSARRFSRVAAVAAAAMAIGAAWTASVAYAAEGEQDMKTVDVRDFGAAPDDGQDDTMAVQAALQAAREQGASRIVFPAGRYDFHVGANEAAPHVAIQADELADVTIAGEDAELILHGYLNCFVLHKCRNVTLQGFTIDCAKMPFSQGDVVAVGDNHVDVRVHDNYPVSGGEPVHAINDYDRETRRRVPRGADIYWSVDGTELIAPQTLRLQTGWRFNLEPGALVLLRHQVYSYNGFVIHECENTTVRDSIIYTVPGMGVTGSYSRDITVERVKILRRPGTDRLVSATADGSHFGGCVGKVIVRDCEFEYQGDDAVNAKHGLYLTILERIDDRTVRAKHNLDMHHPPRIGERLELRSAKTVVPFGVARVAEVEAEADGFTYRIAFDEALPEDAQADALLGCFERNAEFLIQNCIFRDNRARGLLIQVHGATVENCTFDGCTNGAIYLVSDTVHFYECSPARDVTIRNNRFVNCNTQGSNEGVIGIFGWRSDWSELPQPGVFQNIRIENNRIEETDGAALYITGADGVEIVDNLISGVARAPRGDRGKAAIWISASRNVRLTGSTARAEDQHADCAEIVTITDTAERDSIAIADNTGF